MLKHFGSHPFLPFKKKFDDLKEYLFICVVSINTLEIKTEKILNNSFNIIINPLRINTFKGKCIILC